MSMIQTGTLELDSPNATEVNGGQTSTFTSVTFSTPFPEGSTVAVIPMVQTFNGPDTPGIRITQVTTKGFLMRMNELVGNGKELSDGKHAQEKIGWVAFTVKESSSGDPGIPTGFTKVTAKHSGKALNVQGGSKDNGATIIQYGPSAGAENELFQFVPLGDGYYRIVAKNSGKVLDVTAGEDTMKNGAVIRQWDWVSTENQKFRVEPVGDGYYRIVAKHSLRVLTVQNQSKDNLAVIIQWEWADSDNQKWKLS
ncbi:MAG: RICIN domain-containing protein [Pseudonocardiaceae bacterium]